MSNNKSNLKTLKMSNKASILQYLYYNGSSSRICLSENCSLTAASITMLTKELINESYIVEVGEVEKTTSGRKEVLLDLNYESFKALSVTIESEKTYLSICTLKNVIKETTIRTDAFKNDIDILFKSIDEIIDECNEKIFVCGIGIVGRVNEKDGIVENSFGILKDNYPLKAVINKRYDFSTFVVNNVHSQACSLISAKDEDFMFIKYGPGLGCATISKGKIVNGSNGKASELGHIIIDSNGKKCRCGKTGCLETVISEKNLSLIYQKKSLSTKSAEEIIMLYESDRTAFGIIEGCLDKLAIVVSNACTLIDPQKIIFSGKLFDNESIMKSLEEKLNNFGTEIKIQVVSNSNNLKVASSGIYAIKKLIFEVN